MAFEKTELTNAVFTFIQIILGNLFLQKVTAQSFGRLMFLICESKGCVNTWMK